MGTDYFLGIYTSMCPVCQKLLRISIRVPVGHRVVYGCSGCQTHVMELYIPQVYKSRVNYLVDTIGGVDHKGWEYCPV